MKAGAYENDDEDKTVSNKKNNGLPIWGNEKTMNLNPLILTNIQSSQYFKVNLYQLKTYHEVIDEIYYNVTHLEPWEKGSRKTSGQTGMCGGVRGVGAGGIVSTAFCILYKLYTLRLSRKQINGLLNHGDSPYIRGLGFMYLRYTQPPADLWDWFEPYIDDEEEIDVRAGGGQTSTVGQMVRHMLTKLDWYSTLFPRIPVPIQKELEKKLGERQPVKPATTTTTTTGASYSSSQGKTDRYNRSSEEPSHKSDRERSREKDYDKDRQRDRGRDREKSHERDRDHDRKRDRSRERSRDRQRDRNGDYDRGRDRNRERDYDYHKNRDKDRRRSRSRSKTKHNEESLNLLYNNRVNDHRKKDSKAISRDRKHRHRSDRYIDDRGGPRDFADLLEREKHRIKKEKKREGSSERHRHKRSRSHSKDRKHRY